MRMSAESIKSFHGASSQLFKEIRYFSIPLPKPPVFFNVLSLLPVSSWTTFQTNLAPFLELLHDREWSGISCSSMATQLGWFRSLLPLDKSRVETDHFLPKLSDFKGFSKSSCSCQHLRAAPRGVLCSFSLQHSVFGEPSRLWAACPTS